MVFYVEEICLRQVLLHGKFVNFLNMLREYGNMIENNDIIREILSYSDKNEYCFNIVSKDWILGYEYNHGKNTSMKKLKTVQKMCEYIFSPISKFDNIPGETVIIDGCEYENSLVGWVQNPLRHVKLKNMIDTLELLEIYKKFEFIKKLVFISINDKTIPRMSILYMMDIYMKFITDLSDEKELLLYLSNRGDCILFDNIITKYGNYEDIDIEHITYGNCWRHGSQNIIEMLKIKQLVSARCVSSSS